MSNATARLVKAVAGLVIVVVLLLFVSNWWGDYRHAASRLDSTPATGTVEASGTLSSSSTTTTVGIVLIEGLNFRKNPDSAAVTVRGLKKGEKVTIVATKGEWYHVKDSKGVSGWVAAKPQYIKVEKQ